MSNFRRDFGGFSHERCDRARERPGADAPDGVAGVGALPMQHRLQERPRQLHQVLVGYVATPRSSLISAPSENLFRTMADIVVSEGYAAAGYEYINVDDCWLEKERNTYGQLVPDRQRFPRGMKSLADYVSPRPPSPRL